MKNSKRCYHTKKEVEANGIGRGQNIYTKLLVVMSNQALFEKLDQTTELLSTKLIELIRLSSIEDPDDDSAENAISEISIATTGVTMVNNQSMQLIKGVQDLLVLTRNIREKWLLNQIPEQQAAEAVEIEPSELEDLLERCIQEVIEDANVEVNSQISQSPTTSRT